MIVQRSMVVRWMSLTFIGSTLNFTDKSQETMVLIRFNAVRTALYNTLTASNIHLSILKRRNAKLMALKTTVYRKPTLLNGSWRMV